MKVVVTGAAGQIAYSLVPFLCEEGIFNTSEKIDLHLVEIPQAMERLDGFVKELELVGVGYRANNQGQKLDLALGFSHNILFEISPEVKVETISEKGKNPIVKLTSYDKQLLGFVAAKIKSFRKTEPYKGKGIKFVGEQIRRKAGKSA